MELSYKKRLLRFASFEAQRFLNFFGLPNPLDETHSGLVQFRLKVWKLVKAIPAGGWIEVPLETDISRFVEDTSNEYRKAGWEVKLCCTALYDNLGQAFTRRYLLVYAPNTTEKLSAALDRVKDLIPPRLREPERFWWHPW